MSLSTFKEIKDGVAETVRDSQIDALIGEYLNLTINEIGTFHPWTFLRRKTTFPTVASQEDYQAPRDMDKIGLLRQTTSPIKIKYIPDNLFYKYVPNPTAEGNPRWYRMWEEFGVETQLTADDTIDIVSDSTSDDGSTFKVTVTGLDANGVFQVETYVLDGTTVVAGTKTFSKIIQVSKSCATTGTITVTENSGGTSVVTLASWERSPRFKRVSFYPIPSAIITIYLEYYTRLKELVNDSDVPNFDVKWHWVLREGTLAKTFQYQNKEQSYALAQARYQQGLRQMKREDLLTPDHIPYLQPHGRTKGAGVVVYSREGYGSYGLDF